MKAYIFKIQLTNTKREEKAFSEMLNAELLRKQHKKPGFARFVNVCAMTFFVLAELYIILSCIFLSSWTPLSIGVMIICAVGILVFSTLERSSYYDRCIVCGIITLKNIFKRNEGMLERSSMYFFPDYAVMPEGCKVSYTDFKFIERNDYLMLTFRYHIFKRLLYFIKIRDIPQDQYEAFMTFLKESGTCCREEV